MRDWDQLLERYLAEYAARGVSEEGVAQVRRVLERWGQWMKRCRPHPKLEEVDADSIVGFIRSRSNFRTNATVYGILSIMRGMGEYLVREGVWRANPMRWMKGPKLSKYSRTPKRLDRADIEALWRSATEVREAYGRSLWITVLALLYGTGLRRGELARLTIDDWDPEEGLLRIDGRKTGWERRIPVPELTYRCLESYLPLRHNELAGRGKAGDRHLLISARGRALTAQAIGGGVHRIARRTDLHFCTIHQFRHSCASDLLEAGASIVEVQRFLGHREIGTTLRYTHIADPQRSAAIALHPLNEWLGATAAT